MFGDLIVYRAVGDFEGYFCDTKFITIVGAVFLCKTYKKIGDWSNKMLILNRIQNSLSGPYDSSKYMNGVNLVKIVLEGWTLDLASDMQTFS